MKVEPSSHCPYEDDILAVFLDGEPSTYFPILEKHLRNCIHCNRVLDQSRELDAVLSSRTQVSVTDSEADRFLAFLPLKPTSSIPKQSLDPLGQFPLMVLMASVIVSLGVFFFAREGEQIPKQHPSFAKQSDKEAFDSRGTQVKKTSSLLLSVKGMGFAGFPLGIDRIESPLGSKPKKNSKVWKKEFSFRLREEAIQVLKKSLGFFHGQRPLISLGFLAKGDMAQLQSFGPRFPWCESEESALSWFLLQLSKGRVSVVSFLGQVVEGSAPDLGSMLVHRLHNQESAINNLRKWLRQRRGCSQQVASLLGGVLDFSSIPLLVQRGTPLLLKAIRAARSIRGRSAFPFLLALWLETQRRDPPLASRLAPSWFEGMEDLCVREGLAILEGTGSKCGGSKRNGIRKLFRSLGASTD